MIDIIYGLEWYNWVKRYLRLKGRRALPLHKPRKEIIHVLMNGPSLNQTLHYVSDMPGKIMMVNHALSHLNDMGTIRPNYYCAVDPAFLDLKRESVATLYKNLQTYGEKLHFFSVDMILNNLKLDNANIIFHRIYSNPCPEYRGKREKYLLRNNMGSFYFQGVIIAALYVALQLGFKSIYLHGADQDTLKILSVNNKNQLIYQIENMYYYQVNRVTHIDQGNLRDEFFNEYRLFRELYNIQKYANDLDAKIINMSQESWIDCFEKF